MRLANVVGSIVGVVTLAAATIAPVHAGAVLDRIKSTGVMKAASDPAWPPYSFKDENGAWQGFDAAVAEEIAKRIGVKIEFVEPAWDTIVAGQWNGAWDISVGSMSPTEERAKNLDFPIAYYYAPTVMAVHKDNTAIQSPGDATGKRIGVLKGSIFEKYVRHEPMGMADEAPAVYKINDPVITVYEAVDAASGDLAKGDGAVIDAMVDDMMYFLFLIKQGKPLKIVGQPLYYGPSAVAIEPGDPEFAELLRTTVTGMKDDGTLSSLSKKWFGVDLTNKF